MPNPRNSVPRSCAGKLMNSGFKSPAIVRQRHDFQHQLKDELQKEGVFLLPPAVLDAGAEIYFLLSRAASIAVVTCGESGVTAGSNRSTGLPLRSNRNLVKFHLISPPIWGFTDLSVRNT